MIIHPLLALLAAYQQGRLPAQQAAEIEMHLALGCTQCQKELERLQRLASLLTDDARTPAPRPEVIRRAKNLFRSYGPAARPGALRRLIGVLVTSLTPGLADARQAEVAHQVLFTAGEYDIDLHLNPESLASHWMVAGQVLSRGDALDGSSLLSAALLPQEGDVPLVHHSTGEFGEFDFIGVAPGTYTIRLRLVDAEILLPGVLVGEGA